MGKYTSAKSFDDSSSELAQAPPDEQKDAAFKVDVLQVQVRPTFLSRAPLAQSPVHRAALEATASQMRCNIWSAHAGGLGSCAEHNGAGSGELHMYRALRRRQPANQPTHCSCMLSESSQYRTLGLGD